MERADIISLAQEIARVFRRQRDAVNIESLLENGCVTLRQFDNLPHCGLKHAIIGFSRENPTLLQLDISITMKQNRDTWVLELSGPVKTENSLPFTEIPMIRDSPKTISRSEVEAFFGTAKVTRAILYNREIHLTIRLEYF